MKEVDRNLVIVLVVVILLLVAGIYGVSKDILLSPDTELVIPASCSDTDIKAFWDLIFVESSDGITIVSDSTFEGYNWNICPRFFAFKNTTEAVFILDANYTDVSLELMVNNSFQFSAIRANVTEDYLSNLTAHGASFFYEANSTWNFINDTFLKVRGSTISSTEAVAEYTANFGLFSVAASGDLELYDSVAAPSNVWYNGTSTQKAFTGVYNFTGFSYVQEDKFYVAQYKYSFNSGCASDFVEVEGVCTLDVVEVTFEDANNCGNLILPSEFSRSCTVPLDVGSGNVTGNITEFATVNLNAGVEVDSVILNSNSFDLTGVKDIDFTINNNTVVSFDYNFTSEGNLNVSEITLIKQGSSDSFGYLIFNGVDVIKTFRVDRISGGNRVCVKDSVISSISSITFNCTGSAESLVACPGNADGFGCSISGSRFVVTGLDHSGVIEMPFVNTSTSSNTTATTNTTSSPAPCTNNWTCDNWDPEKCVKGEDQNRTCTDSNSCGSDAGKPSESQNCIPKSNSSSIFFFIFIITVVILIFITIGVIIKMVNDKKNTLKKKNTKT